MNNFIPSSSQVAFYTCIATDSLHNSEHATIAAQLAVKSELESLFNVSKSSDAFLTTSPSPSTDSSQATPTSTWQFRGCPKMALMALQNCKLWILFTDGEQERSYHDTFTNRVAKLEIANYPCVFILFGSCGDGPPPATKYYVCSDTFFEARDAILLFHDVGTDQIYVFQAKGCFETLKNGGLTINQEDWEGCKWSELRRLKYEELLHIKLSLPVPLPLEKQLQIHEGRILTNSEYKATKVEADVGDIFDVERLQEIILKAAEKDTFSPRYSKPSIPSSAISRVDINGQAGHIIHMIFMNLDHRSMGIDVPEARIDEYRNDLRAANKVNRLAFGEAVTKKKQENFEKQLSRRKSFLLPVTDPEETFFPGFVRAPLTNRQHNEFRGQCMLCYEEDTILVFLMHHADLANRDHLNHIYLEFVFHSMLVCDACAFHIPSTNSHIERDIIAALPLVSVIDNEGAWTKEFGKVIGVDADEEEILMSIWKWLNTQLGYDVSSLEEGCYRDALHWIMRDLGKWEGTTRNRRYDTKSICY